MAKRKRGSAHARRLKDKLRKREERLKKNSSTVTLPDQMSADSTVPCGSVDGAATAPPSNFLGQVSMGFPLKEEKPLARVQASPRVKMHPPAPRLASPRGSRLLSTNEGKAPSPDSPAWVCAPARAPGPNCGPAGQAQLEGFMLKRTSSIQKDVGNLYETKTKTERNLNRTETEQNMNRYEYETETKQTCKNSTNDSFFRESDHDAAVEFSDDLEITDAQNQSTSIYNRSVQGSFHQADIMFGENAGTQCVTNCLGAVAYHKLKNAEYWDMFDMNIVLTTGNELYTYLQRSSTINNRYLLVSELPQFVECFDKMFEFSCNESLASLISLGVDEPCHDDFNAHTLLDALQISLLDTDGCFVCFGGNTFLVGKTCEKYFIFDSHSRTQEGYQTADGKSIRIIHDTLFDVQQHILSLALSMGFTNVVECEITGVVCTMTQPEDHTSMETDLFNDTISAQTHESDKSCQNNFVEISHVDDSIVYLSEEKGRSLNVFPSEELLTEIDRKEVCKELDLAFTDKEQHSDMSIVEIDGTKLHCRKIKGDGNCLFRAVSYCVSGSEDNHEAIRQATCRHLLENGYVFESLQRNVNMSMNEYMQMSHMNESGTWATEMEVIGIAAMLNINVYTFSCGRWLLHSGRQVNSELVTNRGSIFLHHLNENHYNVISMKCKGNSCNHLSCGDSLTRENSKHKTRLEKRKQKYWSNPEYRNNVLERNRQKYEENKTFKTNSLLKAKKRYETYRAKVLQNRRSKYSTCLQHRTRLKKASVQKYKRNINHQESVKRASVNKYRSNLSHQKNVKKASIAKYKTDPVHRQAVKNASIRKYKSNLDHRTALQMKNTERYKTNYEFRTRKIEYEKKRYAMDENHKEKVKAKSVSRYKDPDFKKDLLEKRKNTYACDEKTRKRMRQNAKKNRKVAKTKLISESNTISLFKKKSKEFPEYCCCCCHRSLFANQVQKCDKDVYKSNNNAENIAEMCICEDFLHNCSKSCPVDCNRSTLWICKTCHRKIQSGKIPAEAAVNKMTLESLPNELKDLNSLERQLIALHIPFMKITNLPQGKQRNIHGPVVCVPADLKKASSLPRTADESMVLRVKLKRKLSYKGYQEYQFVHPHHLTTALDFLITNNAWYKNVQIDRDWGFKASADESLIEKETDVNISEEKEALETETNNVKTSETFDTCLQPADIVQEVLCHYFDDVFDLAPGEGRNPVKLLQEEGNEAKTFPYLFPSGCNSWNEQRDIKITLGRYFHNRLMNADNRFAKDSNYIFFSQYMSELNQVIEKTQISIRKSIAKTTTGKKVTPEMLQDPNALSKMINRDEAIRFMQPIRGTPSYWQSAQKDLFAMLRQIGIPTWFCSFSAAEFRWNTTVEAILRQQCDNRNVDEMNWTEKSEVLRSNPVTVARMFEHRFHIFLRDVIMSPSEPIGKVVDYFQRVEFQQRGSPHMHCLFWIEGAPKLEEDGETAVCDFIDKYVTCEIPLEDEDADLRKIVLDVQQHSKKHSQSCRKKGTECRFNFPRPPSESTFITKPDDNLNVNDTDGLQMQLEKQEAKRLLQTVWEKIQDPTCEYLSSVQLFEALGITQEVFEKAYNTITSKQTIVLQRNPNEVWTNQYNPCLLKCWDANLDIQYVLDPFSCIVYIISYISKSEREMGMLLKQTSIEAEEGNLSARQTLKKIGSAYLHHREVSAQEAVYRVCNLKMKECSRKTVFIPVGENPTRLSKPLHQLKENFEDEEDVWMTSIVERYENRPDVEEFKNMCLAQFCSEFRVLAKSEVPTTSKDSVYELQNGKGYVQRRVKTDPAIIRYPRFSQEKTPEKFYQSMIQLYLPYWCQEHLKPPKFDLYQTFYESGHVRLKEKRPLKSVKEIVDCNRQIYCKNEQIINDAEEMFESIGEPEDAWALLCPETETNRRHCLENKIRVEDYECESEVPDLIEDGHNADILYRVQHSTQRYNMLPLLRSLNETQSEIFYFVRKWCLQKSNGEKPQPFHIFITGGAGTGKSHLIKTVEYEANRLLSKTTNNPESVTVLLTALTGTAAFNINGNTIHHAFALNKYLPFPYEPLQEQRLNSIRVKLQDLQILVIDEVSMVYKRLLYYVHERLVQIKKCRLPFGGVSVIAVGDFFQLPPVKQRKNERLYNENVSYPEDFWKELFKFVELKEIMRQREDVEFAEMLNQLRIRTKDEQLNKKLIEHFRECIREGPEEALHVFATNDEVNDYNLSMLKRKSLDLIEIEAKDFRKDKTSGRLHLFENPVSTKRSEGLSPSILVSVNARIMLTRNVDVEDGLVNGVMGRISEINFSNKNLKEITGITVCFDNPDVGKKSGKRNSSGLLEVNINRAEEEMRGKGRQYFIRHQFPLQLAWACTAHKVQGMTAKEVVVNLDKVFAPGQAYVALSRVTMKNGLYIETSCNDIADLFQKRVYGEADVRNALSEMENFLPQQNDPSNENSYLALILHNVQGLRAHFEDLRSEQRFLKASVICLTETWLESEENKSIYLEDFSLFRKDRSESYDNSSGVSLKLKKSKGGGVAIYYHIKENASEIILPVKNIEVVALLLNQNIAVLTVYRSSAQPSDLFVLSLTDLIKFIKEKYDKAIILGDFNEQTDSCGPIQQYMNASGFTQFVTFPTTEGGTSIDHVYGYGIQQNEIDVSLLPIYYSYHEAVAVKISLPK